MYLDQGPRPCGQAGSATGETRSPKAVAEFELHPLDIRKTQKEKYSIQQILTEGLLCARHYSDAGDTN